MSNVKTTVIKFPLCRLHNFPCKIEVTSLFVSGTPSEFDLQHNFLVDKIAKLVADNNSLIKDIQISEVSHDERAT